MNADMKETVREAIERLLKLRDELEAIYAMLENATNNGNE